MLLEKYQDDLVALENIAVNQDNKLNLSIIMITLKSLAQDELQDIINYLTDKGIEIIYEDIEPVDEENEENEENEEKSLDPKVNPFDPLKIDIKMDKLTMDSLIKRLRYDEFELDSSFQRKFGLWNQKQKSQLIESILLRIPLPAFYFDASDDNKWLIIDGLQRIGTIKEFVVNESFELKGMEFLKQLDGLKYSKLPRALQRRIDETNINAYLVNPSTPKNVKFNIFKRINTGGLVLEPQEIRNALYQGQATEFIKSLAKLPSFISATDGSIKSDRMLDREFCLRYVAFSELSLDLYVGNMEEFLNKTMEFLSKANEIELDRIEEKFILVMDACKSIFGRNTFRKIFDDGRRRPINKAIFESWVYTISRIDESDINYLIDNKEIIISRFIDLCDENTFLNSLKAQDRTSMRFRISKVESTITDLILEGEM